MFAAEIDEHEDRDDRQAQAERNERIAVGARDDEREAEEEERGVENRLQKAGVDGEANVGAQVEAGAAELFDHFLRRGEVDPIAAGREEFERDAAGDKDLIVAEPVGADRGHDDGLVVLQQPGAFEQRLGCGYAAEHIAAGSIAFGRHVGGFGGGELFAELIELPRQDEGRCR